MDGTPPPQDTTSKQYKLRSFPVKKVKLSFTERTESLHRVQDRFVFWTPAILYLCGGFHDAVLSDFLERYNQEVIFYHHRFAVPLFRGLEVGTGNPDWNYVLWAVEREHWEPLLDHICAATVTNTAQQQVLKYAMQEVDIVDPLYLQRASVLSDKVPILTVGAFGVKSNHWVAAFETEGSHPLLAPVKLIFYAADAHCKMYAEALFSGADPQTITQKQPKQKE